MDFIKDAISYDRSTRLGGLYDDQAVFLNMTRFFDDFKFVSNNNGAWLDTLGMRQHNIGLDVSPEYATVDMPFANSNEFADLARKEKGRKFILYSPLNPPYITNPLAYVMNSPTIAHAYENKRYFRDEFTDLINLPEHVIKRIDEIDKNTYDELSANFGEMMVLQDVELSGSKGTMFANNKDEFYKAVESLKDISYSGTIVISKFIAGASCSVQVCITKYGIFIGGLQRQLVNSQYLCDISQKGSTKWCGGELGGIEPDIVVHRAREIATIVGSELSSHGYRGIFGIDLIITPSDEVYAIEINARLTGFSHILSDMQFQKNKIPFMLLHALELSNAAYEVEDVDALPMPGALKDRYSYLIIMNEHDSDYTLTKGIKSGIYKKDGDTIKYARVGYSVADLKEDSEMIILSKFAKTGDLVECGKRIVKIIIKGKTIDSDTNDLDEKAQELIKAIRNGLDLRRKQ
ncbi:ATP-grasp domain-containing protein [Candidatus Saccharibacteria bacterium]|nr:ATP-grasp domain-containing protein [Candidatus Saccharibacteria bacterium]